MNCLKTFSFAHVSNTFLTYATIALNEQCYGVLWVNGYQNYAVSFYRVQDCLL